MGPAADRFYTAVAEGRLTHDGDRRLAAHLAHAVTKLTSYGPVPVKENRASRRRIDLAVGAVLALDRAAATPRSSGMVYAFR